MSMKRKCPKCEVKCKQWVHGKTTKGNVRYRCSYCNHTHIYDEPKYSETFKKHAIKLYLEGLSSRAVGRILGIGPHTTRRWLKKYSNELPEIKEMKFTTAEMDELYTYIKKE